MTLVGTSGLSVCIQHRDAACFPILFPGAGLLAFPACLPGLWRCTPDLQGFPGWRALWMITHPRTTLFPSPRLQRRGRFVRSFQSTGPPACLTAHCVPVSLPNFLSCGFPKNAPPPTSAARVLSRLPRGVVFGPVLPNTRTPSAHVVPPDSGGFLRELPCRSIAPCSQPWGSSRFRRGVPLPVFPHASVLRAFPWLAPHTLRSFSLPGSRTASPRPLPSRRRFAHCFQLASLDLMALLLQGFRCRLTQFPVPASPMLPWALFPFKALPSTPLPIGQPRSVTAVAALLWATPT